MAPDRRELLDQAQVQPVPPGRARRVPREDAAAGCAQRGVGGNEGVYRPPLVVGDVRAHVAPARGHVGEIVVPDPVAVDVGGVHVAVGIARAALVDEGDRRGKAPAEVELPGGVGQDPVPHLEIGRRRRFPVGVVRFVVPPVGDGAARPPAVDVLGVLEHVGDAAEETGEEGRAAFFAQAQRQVELAALARVLQENDVGEIAADLPAPVVGPPVRGPSHGPAPLADIEVAEPDVVQVPGRQDFHGADQAEGQPAVDGEIRTQHPGQSEIRVDDVDFRGLGRAGIDGRRQGLIEGGRREGGDFLSPEGGHVDAGELQSRIAVGVG